MVANEVLKKITLSNVFVDAMNNTSGILQEEINHKTDYLLNNNTIGLLLDVAVVGMEYSPIPQVKAAGFLLDGIIIAADFYTLLEDNEKYTTCKNFHIINKDLVLDAELREQLQKEDDIKNVDMTKLNMDSLHAIMDIADNVGMSTTKYRIATTVVLLMANGKIFYNTYLSDSSDEDKNQQDLNNDDDNKKTSPYNFLPPPLQNLLGKLLNQLKKAKDPVVLNLSEEGQAKSLENSFSHFDYDGDGFAEHTAWIGDKQGLLVVDINENGILNIIKFNSKKITSTDAEGNKLESIGFFMRSDGTTGEIRDYYFETDEMNTFNKTRKYFLKLCLNIDNYILQEYYTPRLQIKDVLKEEGAMEEILQDIHEFPFYSLAHAITWSTIYLIGTYFIRIREPKKNWWKHWKALAVVFLIIWLIWSSSEMGRPFVKHENFDSLTKIEGILKYDDDKGIYLTTFNSFNKERYFKIKEVHLLDYVSNVMTYENKSVTIWQKNNIAYQLECNGNVIYSLDRSNEKVWLGIIWDLIRYYFFSFCGLLFFYVAILRFIKDKDKEEGIYDE